MLSREHRDDVHVAGGAGGKAAEEGRQAPAATRSPRTPSSHNIVNVAPNTQQLIETAAAFLETLDAPNVSSSSIQTSLLRVFLCEAKDTLTALFTAGTIISTPDHKRHPPRGPGSSRSRQRPSDAASLAAFVPKPNMGSNCDRARADTAEIP